MLWVRTHQHNNDFLAAGSSSAHFVTYLNQLPTQISYTIFIFGRRRAPNQPLLHPKTLHYPHLNQNSISIAPQRQQTIRLTNELDQTIIQSLQTHTHTAMEKPKKEFGPSMPIVLSPHVFWTKLRVTISVKVNAEETASCNVETGSATVCCFTIVLARPILLIVQNANSTNDSAIVEEVWFLSIKSCKSQNSRVSIVYKCPLVIFSVPSILIVSKFYLFQNNIK